MLTRGVFVSERLEHARNGGAHVPGLEQSTVSDIVYNGREQRAHTRECSWSRRWRASSRRASPQASGSPLIVALLLMAYRLQL